MVNIISDETTGLITISDSYTASNVPTFNKIGDEYTLSFVNLENVLKFDIFSYTASNISDIKYLTTTYRISRDANKWTPWLELKTVIDNFIPFDPKYKMYIDIKWIRVGDSNTGTIYLTDYTLQGTLDIAKNDGLSAIKLNSANSETIIKPPYIYKAYKINDIEILSKGDITNTTIYYRYSQDHGRTISNWIEFTKENIRSERINPIRFFQIEYLIKYNGNTNVTILDINILGEFQNVSLDAQKSNLYGVRENCNCLILGIINDQATYDYYFGQQQSNTSMMISKTPTELYNLTPSDKAALYRPYDITAATLLLDKLNNDAVAILGHDAVYVLTDPDKNGIDYTFHDYTLQNYVCDKLLKYTVDNNQFPDNQITFNQYTMALFDTFEIQISKQDFKAAFGVDKRPGNEDILWMCNLNRLYQVEHAQPVRSFNNNAIYYKLTLKKADRKANIIGANDEIQSVIDNFMANSTNSELFGLENNQDKKAVANQEQYKTLAQDTLRVNVFASILKEPILNSSNIIAKTNYDLSTINGGNAVIYRNFKNFFQLSDNIAYTCWFNINNITTNDTYNFFNYHDGTNGIKINMLNTDLIITINAVNNTFTLPALLSEDVWYSLIVNIDQRQKTLSAYIYKRNVTSESDAVMLSSTKLLRVYRNSKIISPTIIDLSDSLDTNGAPISASIIGSDMKITNIRMFIDVIPENEHNKLLNKEMITSDYKYIIFSDNANKIVSVPFYSDSKIDFQKIRRGTALDPGNIYETGSDK